MVATDLLPRYPFFSFLKPEQRKKLAAISVEDSYESGSFIFREGEQAEWLYILMKGSVDLLYLVDLLTYPSKTRELVFGSIQPGEIFGISALIEPHILTSTARAAKNCQVIKIDAKKLLSLCEQDEKLAYALYNQVAKAAIARLNAARLQLAAAWAATRA